MCPIMCHYTSLYGVKLDAILFLISLPLVHLFILPCTQCHTCTSGTRTSRHLEYIDDTNINVDMHNVFAYTSDVPYVA